MQPPKDSKQKKDSGKSKKDKDPVNKSGGKAKKKVKGKEGVYIRLSQYFCTLVYIMVLEGWCPAVWLLPY